MRTLWQLVVESAYGSSSEGALPLSHKHTDPIHEACQIVLAVIRKIFIMSESKHIRSIFNKLSFVGNSRKSLVVKRHMDDWLLDDLAKMRGEK